MDNYFKCDIIDNIAKELNFTPTFSPVYRPNPNMVERVHRDLRTLLPDLKETMKGQISPLDWSGLLPIAANIINTVPHSTTGYPPYYLHNGYLSNDVFENKSVSGLKTLWADARQKMLASQEKTLKSSKAPVPLIEFEKGDNVYAYLGNDTSTKAKIVKDHGNTCLIDKGEDHPPRYRLVVLHKSRIAKNLPELSFDYEF